MRRQSGQMPSDATPNAWQPRLLLLLQTMVVVSASTAEAVEQHEHDVWTAAQTAPRVVAKSQITSQLIQEARGSDVTIDHRGVSSSGDSFAVLATNGVHAESIKDNLTASKKTRVHSSGTISSSSGDGVEWRNLRHNSTLIKEIHKGQRFKRSSITGESGRLDTGPCERGWTLRKQSCYKGTPGWLSWSEARRACLLMNASLTHIDSFNKQQDVYDIFPNQSGGWWRAWIGLNRLAGDQWIWDSGQQLTYGNWAKGEPNSMKGDEDCVELYAHERAGWNDINCSVKLIGICEKRKPQTQHAQVRLVGTASVSEHSGMVEVNYGGEWGIVCDDDWDISDARVICRQLGYGDAINASRNLNATSRNFFLDDVDCNGSEQSIDQCAHRPWKEHNCGNEEAAGVICQVARAHYLECGKSSRGPGVLMSPDISDSKESQIKCNWIINALNNGNSLQLRFNNLMMEECCDYLVISDGSGFQYTFSGVRQSHQLKLLHLQSPATVVFFANKSSTGSRGSFDAVVGEVSGRAKGICRSVHWTRWGQSCFRVLRFTKGISWHEAHYQCRSLGGFLAEIPSNNEQQNVENFLVNQNLTVNEVWIGMKRRQSVDPWRWESGSSLTYSNWIDEQPRGASLNETCVSLIYRGLRGWRATNCNEQKVPLCMLQRA